MSATIGAALAEAARTLAATSDTPRLDAELLMAHALGTTREALLLGGLAGAAPDRFAALVARRADHEPVAYITGRRAFWTIELDVSHAVLIPRPDSETLIEAAVAHFGRAGPARVLDLGTGSGALVLAALDEWPNATGVGVDASAAAVAVARGNAARLGMAARADIRLGGWEEAGAGTFDLVLCNPPYIARDASLPRDVAGYEPHSALFAGDDGLDDHRVVAAQLRLPAGSMAAVEIGADQAGAARALYEAAGFAVAVRPDLAGCDRAFIVTPQP